MNRLLAAAAGGEAATCRICRSEGTYEEPLFHPCRCSGSIGHVHQECLVEWLSHSQKKHCELCKTPFRFTKLYDAQMPTVLPWTVFSKQALIHMVNGVLRAIRALLVVTIWMVILPWIIRWSWRWSFWFADAGWARDIYFARLSKQASNHTMSDPQWSVKNITRSLQDAVVAENVSTSQMLYGVARDLLVSIGIETFANTTHFSTPHQWQKADASVFSSISYLSALTPYPTINRILLDIFEGQLITCTVILAFILIFLIREWVLVQQPIVNRHQQQQQLQQQILHQQQHQVELVQRQQQRLDLLDQARRTLEELEGASAAMGEFLEQTNRDFDEAAGRQPQPRRPPMPNRDASSRAVRVQRLIEEADAFLALDEDGELKVPGLKTTQPAPVKRKPKELPLTNAGPDAKLNIQLLMDLREVDVPEPRTSSKEYISNEELAHRLAEITEDDSDDEPESRLAAALDIGRAVAELEARPNPFQRFINNAADAMEANDARDAADEQPIRPSPFQRMTNNAVAHAARNDQAEQQIRPSPFQRISDAAALAIDAQDAGQQARPSPFQRISDAAAIQVARDTQDAEQQARPSPFQRMTNEAVAAVDADEGIPEAQRPGQLGRPSPFQRMINEAAVARDEEEDWEDDDDTDAETDRDNDAAVRPEDLNLEMETELRPEEQQQKTTWDTILDWYWGDITVQAATEAEVPADDEQQLDENANEAPFVPVHHAHGHVHVHHDQHDHADPDVMAAAQQAGLDAEQIDDGEDLEGIMELVGLRGPLAGLLQTSLFCLLLVICTVAAAVVLPYAWGKLVLSFIGSPFLYLVKVPLQIMSFLADFIVDITLFFGSWFVTINATSIEAIITLVASIWPKLSGTAELPAKLSSYALAEAQASGGRLYNLFAGGDAIDPLGINAGFLGASIHSHAALRDLQAEIDAAIAFVAGGVQWLATTLTLHNNDNVLSDLGAVFQRVVSVPTVVRNATLPYVLATRETLSSMKNGSITFQGTTSSTSFDPALMYWSSTDRALAVCAGYAALAFIATIYVAADTPLTRSARNTEKMIRDNLRQAGGIFKVILIISIEMLVFPFYCGLLLDLAFLPLFANASMTSRVALASTAPYLFCFVHWFVGTCYMFHFALFVGMCRKILRKGVLWFIRDPDDPNFHPVRDVLERNVVTQLRKIAFSALVYGALVILCLGGVIWSIGKVFKGIFPIYWTATEPTLEFPMDLLLYNFVTPVSLQFLKPSKSIHSMYAWWLRKCARMLRLSHFLFDQRQADEEGHFTGKAWSGVTRFLQPISVSEKPKDVVARQKPIMDPGFKMNGQYVLTPCNDQYRPPKAGDAFMHINKHEMFITNKDGARNEFFAKVYIPPHFKARVSLFMVCMWIFSAFSGLCATFMPLVLGRTLLGFAMPWLKANDIYAYTIGAYAVGSAIVLVRQGPAIGQKIRSSLSNGSIAAFLKQSGKVLFRVIKLLYIYGLTFVVVPLVLSTIIEAHFMAPLHTYFRLNAGRSTAGPVGSNNGTTAATMLESMVSTPTTQTLPAIDHTVHVVQDMALGILLFRIGLKHIFSGPQSRSDEVLRRVTAKGRLDLDAWLVTRYLLLPIAVLAFVELGLPLLFTRIAVAGSRYAGYEPSARQLVLIYRFSFPALSASVCLIALLFEVGKATSRWRMRIRDEVYLVGERLHNFGEKKPPQGTRSVMRREAAPYA